MLKAHPSSKGVDLTQHEHFVDLLTGLLHIDPDQRFSSIEQVLAHPYFYDYSDCDSVATEFNQEIMGHIESELNSEPHIKLIE